MKHIIKRILDDDVAGLGAQLAYSLLLAFFPFLMFLITLLGYSSIKSVDVLAGLNKVLPKEVFVLIQTTIVEIVDTRNPNLLSFGIIAALWASSGGFKAVIKGLNKAYDENEKRSYLKVQLISLLCTLGLALILILSFLLLVLGEVNGNLIAKYLGFDFIFKRIWNTLRYIFTVSIMVFIFAALYRYTPSRRLTWKEVFPGALFTTLGWILSSIIFSYYINNFANYSKVYGSIGAVIIFITWLYLISVVLIIGGEINAELSV